MCCVDSRMLLTGGSSRVHTMPSKASRVSRDAAGALCLCPLSSARCLALRCQLILVVLLVLTGLHAE